MPFADHHDMIKAFPSERRRPPRRQPVLRNRRLRYREAQLQQFGMDPRRPRQGWRGSSAELGPESLFRSPADRVDSSAPSSA